MTTAKSNMYAKALSPFSYAKDGLVAMYDGQWNSVHADGSFCYDANEKRVLELISKTHENFASEFRCDKAGMFYEVTKSSIVSRTLTMAQKMKQCIQNGYARLEGVLFVNCIDGAIYGNRISLCNGSFGINFHTGSAGSWCCSTAWIFMPNVLPNNLDRAYFSLEITNDMVTYQVMDAVGIGTRDTSAMLTDTGYIDSQSYQLPHETCVFSLRLYSTPLSDQQTEANRQIDKERFGI